MEFRLQFTGLHLVVDPTIAVSVQSSLIVKCGACVTGPAHKWRHVISVLPVYTLSTHARPDM